MDTRLKLYNKYDAPLEGEIYWEVLRKQGDIELIKHRDPPDLWNLGFSRPDMQFYFEINRDDVERYLEYSPEEFWARADERIRMEAIEAKRDRVKKRNTFHDG